MSYSSFGFDIPGVVTPAQTGIGVAAAKAACAATGGVWNDLTGLCIEKITPIIGPVIQSNMSSICAQVNGVWDPAANACKPNPEPPPSEGLSTTAWLVIGASVLGAAVWFGSRKKTTAVPNRRRARRNNLVKTDFERLKDCSREVASLRREVALHRTGG